MHRHNFREITQNLPKDDFLHAFECECGFTILEKERIVKTNSGQKKIRVSTILRK